MAQRHAYFRSVVQAHVGESLVAPFTGWRVAVFALPFCLAAAFVAYLTINVPVDIPTLPGAEARRYSPAAIMAVAVVLSADALVIAGALRRARRAVGTAHQVGADASRLAGPLRLEAVPPPMAYVSAAASLALFVVAVMEGLPEWGAVVCALLPWIPVLAIEGVVKLRHYGVFAFFVAVALAQTGHLGEHLTQVTQLLMTDGDLDRSHGVFGQLDFETVHFVWDTMIWLTTCLVVWKLAGGAWLWAAFAFASMHEIEHVYLYWLFLTDYNYYMRGGLEGIMGRGGVVGSPLYRPYLHFIYNLLVTVPMLIGLRVQARRIEEDAQRPR